MTGEAAFIEYGKSLKAENDDLLASWRRLDETHRVMLDELRHYQECDGDHHDLIRENERLRAELLRLRHALREIHAQAEVARDLDEFVAFVLHHAEDDVERLRHASTAETILRKLAAVDAIEALGSKFAVIGRRQVALDAGELDYLTGLAEEK